MYVELHAHSSYSFLVGASLTVAEGAPAAAPVPFHVTVLAESAVGWRNLCRLITEAHADTRPRPDREPLPPSLRLSSLLERSEGLVCLSGCARDGALAGGLGRAGGKPSPAGGRRARG